MASDRHRAILSLLRRGLTAPETAKALNVHRSTVYRALQRAGIDPAQMRAKFLRRTMQLRAVCASEPTTSRQSAKH